MFQFDVPVEPGDAKVAIRWVSPRRVIGIQSGTDRPEILVVDDQAENRDWLMKLLASIGFSVRGADNGEAAIRIWEEWKPRLILMDVHMPIMNGLEATRRIKSNPGDVKPQLLFSPPVRWTKNVDTLLKAAPMISCRSPAVRKTCSLQSGHFSRSLTITKRLEPTANRCSGRPVSNAAWLAQLPLDLAEELRDATLRGNKKLLNKVIGKLRESDDAGFANAIQDLADRYQYDVLAQLLEEACRR